LPVHTCERRSVYDDVDIMNDLRMERLLEFPGKEVSG
jgi:hypothetical protein